MLIRRAEDVPGTPMDIDGVAGVTMRMMVGRVDGAPNFAMRHFTIEPGGHSPHHSHNYEHEVFIVDGGGTFECDGTDHAIAAGDVLLVEPNCVHQFRNTTDAPMSFLCLVPLEFDCGSDGSRPVPGS